MSKDDPDSLHETLLWVAQPSIREDVASARERAFQVAASADFVVRIAHRSDVYRPPARRLIEASPRTPADAQLGPRRPGFPRSPLDG